MMKTSHGSLEKQLIMLAFFILVLSTYSCLYAENADSVLEMIQNKYSKLKSFTADFTQSFASRALGSAFEESGKLYIKMPGQMRWDYEKPEEKIAVYNGAGSWLYIKEDNTVIKGNLDASESSRALLSLFTGMADLKRLFEGEVISRNNSNIIVKITLKAENDQFDHLIVAVDQKSKMVVRIEVFDLLGNTMTYLLKNIKENNDIKPDIFQFSIPPGAQLIFE